MIATNFIDDSKVQELVIYYSNYRKLELEAYTCVSTESERPYFDFDSAEIITSSLITNRNGLIVRNGKLLNYV